MYGGFRYTVNLAQGSYGRFKVGSQLQGVSQMKRRLLIVAVRFEYLAQGEVLLPCAAVWRLHLQGSTRQIYGIIQVLQSEEHPPQVQQNLEYYKNAFRNIYNTYTLNIYIYIKRMHVCTMYTSKMHFTISSICKWLDLVIIYE